MDNCIFVDEHDVLDKLAHVFSDASEMQRLTDAGYQLVHARHTSSQRSQIFDWYVHQQHLRPGQRIIQRGPFEGLEIVEQSSGLLTAHVKGDGLHLRLIREGDALLGAKRYRQAEQKFSQCMNYMRWMPEPKLRLALCRLYQGDARGAKVFLEASIGFILGSYEARDPDPVEWAYYVVALCCLAEHSTGIASSREFPWLHHPTLDRTRWAAGLLEGMCAPGVASAQDSKQRATIHTMDAHSASEWLKNVLAIARACGAHTLAAQLDAHADCLIRGQECLHRGSVPPTLGPAKRGLWPPKNPLRRVGPQLLVRRFRRDEWRSQIRGRLGGLLRRFERRSRIRLPFRERQAHDDAFRRALCDRVSVGGIAKALIIGTAERVELTRALVPPNLNVVWELFPITATPNAAAAVEAVTDRICADTHASEFDIVVFDGTVCDTNQEMISVPRMCLTDAQVVVLYGVNSATTSQLEQRILGDACYDMSYYDPVAYGGCAMFVRRCNDTESSAFGRRNDEVAKSVDVLV